MTVSISVQTLRIRRPPVSFKSSSDMFHDGHFSLWNAIFHLDHQPNTRTDGEVDPDPVVVAWEQQNTSGIVSFTTLDFFYDAYLFFLLPVVYVSEYKTGGKVTPPRLHFHMYNTINKDVIKCWVDKLSRKSSQHNDTTLKMKRYCGLLTCNLPQLPLDGSHSHVTSTVSTE